MKTSSVVLPSTSLALPQINKTLNLPVSNRKTTAGELSNACLPPTDEFISYINRIGHEYPFCVYYKVKTNDPL
jgi:hypothetical protein